MLLHNQYEFNPDTDLIAKGGFAEVFKAYDRNLDIFVAIKRFNTDGGSRGSVIKEIRKSIGFQHPNIIRYFNCFTREVKDALGRTITEEYGVMEYANAGSLSYIISGKKKVSTENFKDIILGILDGLHYLHTLPTPIIHRDLKPSNILLQEQGGKLIPKICDFGISKEWQDATTTGTMTGMVGTMEYMSPEQIAGKGIQPNTDLWALGCIIFEYFTGQPPFGKVSSGTSIPVLNNNILNATYSTTQLNKIPEPFRALVKACLVKDAGKRVHTAEGAKAILQGRPTPTPPNGWNFGKLARLAVVILVILGVVLFIVKINDPNKHEEIPVAEEVTEEIVEEPVLEEAPVADLPQEPPTSITPPVVHVPDEAETRRLQAEQQKLAEEKAAMERQRQELERQKQQAAEAEKQRQSTSGAKAGLPAPLQKLVNDMVYVQGGTFTMGCTWEQESDCEGDEKPTRSVTLSSYSIGKYEITQAQWRAVMNNNPSRFSGCDNCPVEQVSWENVQDFIRKLNQMTGLNFRLPTEAEWEYAARGGASTGSATKYAGSGNLGSVAWYDDNSSSKTHPVGQKKGNELGLYDMSGNVWEWCSDWYDSDYYGNSPRSNPKGPSTGTYRVYRGGSWGGNARSCRVSYRSNWYPSSRYTYLGFRLAHD